MKKKYSDFNPFFLKILNLNYILEFINLNFKKILFSNSLNFEDIFLLYFIDYKKLDFNIFFLNTGKIFLNILNFINKINFKFIKKIKIYFPNFFLINFFIKKFNLNSFYNNIILRKVCCFIRKIEIYNKVINDYDIIITGQRNNRISNNNLKLEFDKLRFSIKYNILFNWDYKDIFYFMEKFNILNNFVYNYNYANIGCFPCTRISYNHEQIRAGRWWWENTFSKECGLHI